MSVDRRLKIRIITNIPTLSELVKKIVGNFFNFKNKNGTYSGISINDDEDFDYQEYDEETIYQILDIREKKKQLNAVTFWDKEYSESFGLLIYSLETNYENYKKHYLFSFSPDCARKIDDTRLTDYGYYLNKIIPEFLRIDCEIAEVKCHDFDF